MVLAVMLNRALPPVYYRYQSEQPSMAYQMASTQDEPELVESFNEGSIEILPGAEERFSVKNLLFPENTDPSQLSGFTVNICTSTLGQTCTALRHAVLPNQSAPSYLCTIFIYYILSHHNYVCLCLSLGILICIFCVVAVQGGFAPWSVSILTILVVVCLGITFVIWRQPQSKTKLTFKVGLPSPTPKPYHNNNSCLLSSECKVYFSICIL